MPTTAPVRAEARYPALVIVALALLLLIVVDLPLCGLAGALRLSYAIAAQASEDRRSSWVELTDHLLGTDELGRDVLSRLIYAIRFSVLVALGGTLIGAFIGTTLGFIAAHFRGLIEEAIMMLADVQASLPFMMIALALIAMFGGGFMLFIAIMGFYGWEVFARLTRGVVIAANTQGYATAVVALGAPARHVYLRHVLPNILSVLIVQFTLNFPQVILLETSLSFLGPGHPPAADQPGPDAWARDVPT
jgi:peptide/nickel transport system permease protein